MTTRSGPRGWPPRRRMSKVYDLNGAVGGPIKKDRIWFFVNARTEGSTRINREPVLQPERRRSDEVALRAGLQPSGVLGSDVGERQRADHLAGDARATRSACSGTSRSSAGSARERQPGWRRRRRSSRLRPTASARPSRCACSRSPGARRRRAGCSSTPGSARRITAGASSSATATTRAVLCAFRNSARPAAPRTEGSPTSITALRTGTTTTPARTRGAASISYITGRAQPQVRPHGHLLQRRSHELHERPAAQVPRQ